MTQFRDGYSGTGPGPLTRDGCAVELWARLPAGRDAEVVAAVAPRGGRVLELGAGVGRVTRGLLERGLLVTAVDESPDMLARILGTRTVLSAIESLDLGETFDVVVLGSFLVHAGDEALRQGMLETVRRHVADGGVALVQREGGDWHDEVPREGPLGEDGLVRIAAVDPVRPGVHRVRAEYVFPDAVWTQTFESRPLTDAQFAAALAAAGLAVDRPADGDATWVLSRPL